MPPAHALAWWLLPLLAALALTRWAIGYSHRRQLLDRPGARRSHSQATPRGGGIAIVLAVAAALLVAMLEWPTWRPLLAATLLGLAIVATAGWVDDHRPTSPWLRLAMHMLAALVLAAGAWHGLGAWPALLAFVMATGLVNVWNFMDGINGIAAGQAVLFGVAVALFGSGPAQALGLALAGACCGFLPFNAPRARIFMGDVGSGALGFLAAAGLLLAAGGSPQHWLLLAMPLAPFMVDTALTLLSRMMRRERWWEAHVQHVFQRLAHAHGHMPVTLGYLLFAAAGLALAALLQSFGLSAEWGVSWWSMSAWYALTALVWASLRRSRRSRESDH